MSKEISENNGIKKFGNKNRQKKLKGEKICRLKVFGQEFDARN